METNEDDVPQQDAEFIRESIAADCRRDADEQRRSTLIFRGIVAAPVVTLLLALAAAWFGYQAQQETRRAEMNATNASAQAKRADNVANQAQLARSRYLAVFATESLTRVDVDNAIGLARAALPANIGVPKSQIVMEAFNALYSAYAKRNFRRILK